MNNRAATGAILNAIIGDDLAARGSALAIEMGLYDRGRPLAALPEGTSRLAVFVHGMACTETCWSFPDDPERSFGAELERAFGMTPLYVRYNTGRPIWENGVQLAALLSSIVERSPVPITELDLLGHSLGGLVIRSALFHGREDAWRPLVRRGFYIGTPHKGSPLEKAGRLATSVMQAIDDPVVRLVGDIADVRSRAVKDLGRGDIVEDAATVPLDEDIDHYLVAGTLPGPLALFGDGLVRVPSATDGALRTNIGVFPGRHHMALLHDEEVYRWIAARCGPPRPTTPVVPRVRSNDATSMMPYVELAQVAVDVGSTAVQKAHEAIAARPYDVLEAVPELASASRAVRAVHFGILRGSYGAVRWVNGLLRG